MTFEESLATSVSALQALVTMRPEIERAGDLILKTLKAGNKLLICGNGGSAAEAAHFSTELTGRYFRSRRSLPAIALSADGALQSCIANDFGLNEIFARQVQGLGQTGDLVVGLSSSGNSPNVISALHVAREMKLPTLALLGRSGGLTAGVADIEIIIPGTSGAAAQEAHLFLIHHFCERIDEAFVD